MLVFYTDGQIWVRLASSIMETMSESENILGKYN